MRYTRHIGSPCDDVREVEVDSTNVRMRGDDGCNCGALAPTYINEGFHIFEPIVALQCFDFLRSLYSTRGVPELPILGVNV